MAASLTEKELERLRLELWRRRAGGHMTMALSLDTVDTLLASARAVRKVEQLATAWEQAGRHVAAKELRRALWVPATAEPTDGEER
jgi:hypothetical protein